jgi:RNA polymerase sigma-70 factor (ECF subfamily)
MPPDPSSEEIRRAAAGDVAAFTRIVERYQGMAYSVAYKMLGDRQDAEDAAQEAFMSCYRRLATFRGDSLFSTWMFRLVVSAAADVRRREARRRAAGTAAASGQPVYEARDPADGGSLAAAFAELPLDYRVPTVLRDVYGLAYQDIADVTGRPLGTVKVMVHRGRASLRLRLRSMGLVPQAYEKRGGA